MFGAMWTRIEECAGHRADESPLETMSRHITFKAVHEQSGKTVNPYGRLRRILPLNERKTIRDAAIIPGFMNDFL